jgi:hypothetical protein
MGVRSNRAARLAALTVALIGAAGCASLNIGSYLAGGADLREYHTYAWGPSDPRATGDPRLDSNPFVEERVREQIETGLNRHGFEPVNSASPDLFLHYHLIVSQTIDARELDNPYGFCDEFERRPCVYDAGTLFIDLVDGRTNTLVWRGWSEGRLDFVIDDQTAMEIRIDDTVDRILRKLPSVLQSATPSGR